MPEVVIASYNVHGCRGTDGAMDVDRVVDVIRDLRADAVGLQEVDCRRGAAGGPDQLTRIADGTGLTPIPGPTIRARDGYFGNAILSRHPATDVTQANLSYRRREPRGMMEALLQVGAHRLRFVVTHFGLRARERRHQVRKALAVLRQQFESETRARSIDALVLAGDFNEWRWRSATLVRLHEAFGRAPALRTFPSRFPLLALDRIWVWPRASLVRLSVTKTPAARTASDHLPIRAVLELGGADGGGLR